MLTFASYALVFFAGLIACDLVRIAQERRALTRITRIVVAQSDPVETTVSRWAADPHNWCNRPGCPRCWGRWGR